MAYGMTDEERQEYDGVITQTIENAQGNGSRLMQIATDATRFLSVASNTIDQIKESGFFQRLRDLLPTGKRTQQMNDLQNSVNSLSVSQEEIREMQKMSWRMIEQLNERNLLTADALITVKNNLNTLAVEQNEVKNAIISMANKVADRFEKLENRVADVEESQRLNTWISGIEVDDYYKSLPKTIRFLKIVKDYYERKKSNYSRDELKLLRLAIRSAGLDFNEPVSLGDITDSLIEELQKFDESEYLKITKIILPDNATITNKELSDILAVPSFVTICMLPESKKRLEPAVEALKDSLQCDESEALKKIVKNDIQKHNGIDMSVKMPLADLGIELISCYSAIPDLVEAYKKEEPEKLKKKEDNNIEAQTDDSESEPGEYEYEVAEKLFEEDKESNAKKIFLAYKVSAEKGYAPAFGMLANCYFEGLGCDIDYNAAFLWAKKGSELNYAVAIRVLADCYDDGLGTLKDEAEAFSLYLELAKEGYISAQRIVGYKYLVGDYVQEDEEQAFNWLQKAVSGGDSAAKYFLGTMYWDGKLEEDGYQLIKQAAEEGVGLARDWLRDHGYGE